jgi:hypothetical protein
LLVPAWIEQSLGVALVLFILLDVFLTVLYARLDSGVLSYHLARVVWLFFRRVSTPFGRHRAKVLSFCGPLILVLMVFAWALLLTVGMALIIHPRLGTAVISTSVPTRTDFISALYAGGGTMSVAGANGFVPMTAPFKLLFMLNSLVGISVISLTLTYFMQVYSALNRRNSLGYSVHLASGETGDAAELIAGLGAEGHLSGGYTNISELATQIAGLKESHHFYPVLFYFRFPDPVYSVSRITLVLLDLVSLLKSGLDDEQYGWVKESAPVTQLWRGCLALDLSLAEAFLSGPAPEADQPADEQTRERWRRRYFAAVRRLAEAGIATNGDTEGGAENYVHLRERWQPHIDHLGAAGGFTPAEVDPVEPDPEVADRRPDFRRRLHTVG